MKQTAVEYLSEQIRLTNIEGLRFQLWDAIEQAKKMEKEQIIDVCNNAQKTDFYVKYYDAEQYYNETFKNKYETKT